MIIIRESIQTAQKRHVCHACFWIIEGLSQRGLFEIADLRKIVKARRNGYMIVPGDKYIKQIQKVDGEFVVFKALVEMDKLCWKYDLYPEND